VVVWAALAYLAARALAPIRHLRPADAGVCASRCGGGASDSKTLPEYSPRPACCVRMWRLIAQPLGRDWVCVWRGAGGHGDGGEAGWHALRGETSTNTVCYQDFQE
jgi:hypothetical protein